MRLKGSRSVLYIIRGRDCFVSSTRNVLSGVVKNLCKCGNYIFCLVKIYI